MNEFWVEFKKSLLVTGPFIGAGVCILAGLAMIPVAIVYQSVKPLVLAPFFIWGAVALIHYLGTHGFLD